MSDKGVFENEAKLNGLRRLYYNNVFIESFLLSSNAVKVLGNSWTKTQHYVQYPVMFITDLGSDVKRLFKPSGETRKCPDLTSFHFLSTWSVVLSL